tara:strand:+ start:178 stop:435 length:258 start_codon:yes stop_codon:yes gene_type:complete
MDMDDPKVFEITTDLELVLLNVLGRIIPFLEEILVEVYEEVEGVTPTFILSLAQLIDAFDIYHERDESLYDDMKNRLGETLWEDM